MAKNEKLEFKTVQLFKDQILGIGSYGKVCKAECDGLLCGAKVIHETLFDPTAQQLIAPQRVHRLPMRRFEQECEFLSTIRHPNIIQYLGMYQDPDTRLPVLLMELMDDSLTHFLESSPQPIPYHIQVNICHDITLALSFLHSNGIVHRDLSSNNVLMMGNVRAKVTDFGMARLREINPQVTHLSFTVCPGADVYMPPEAVQDKAVYTEKIDCFSFGVVAIQIMTRLFPKPGDRRRKLVIKKIGEVEKRISECERRQNHISKIPSNNPLLAIALDCLKDEDAERPNAQELCTTVRKLKEMPEYGESIKIFQKEQKTVFLEIEKMHRDKMQILQAENTREVMEIRDQLEREREEEQRTEKQINKLQVYLSEMNSGELHKLCHEGDMKGIKAYINRINDGTFLGRMLVKRRGIFGYTPLHEAAASGKHEVLKYLLNKTSKTDVNYRANSGYTPLHLAAISGHDKCVRELLIHGADVSCVDEYGKTPSQAAELASKGKIVNLLRSEGELCFNTCCKYY